jgi:uncharacterized protein YbaR (Trm112 family)
MAETGPLGIPSVLFDVLACPCPDHSPLSVDEGAAQLVCTTCGSRFDVRDGVPVMLIGEGAAGSGG